MIVQQKVEKTLKYPKHWKRKIKIPLVQQYSYIEIGHLHILLKSVVYFKG